MDRVQKEINRSTATGQERSPPPMIILQITHKNIYHQFGPFRAVVAIATFSDWLKRLAPVFQPMRIKTKTNRAMYA